MDGLGSLGKLNFQGLEERLDQVLIPVNPDPAFVNALKHKLAQTPSVFLETSRQHSWLAIVGLGLVSGALAYWLIKKLNQ